MGRYFEENYSMLKHKMVEMGVLVQQIVANAVDCLQTGDLEKARATVQDDERVDRLEVEIDELVLKLLALQQPMAIDLRFLITALKINNDLERMGDQAVNVAENILLLKTTDHQEKMNTFEDFQKMEEVVLQMVQETFDSFTSGDVALARTVIERDDAVDDLNKKIIGKLVSHLRTNAADADACVAFLLITRNLERIGDLCTNIAEDVIYYVEGKIIKHAHA
jgi:phosphate transport system protein